MIAICTRRLLLGTLVALATAFTPLAASAAPLMGGIGFGGVFDPTPGPGLDTATGIVIDNSTAVVSSATLSFAPASGLPATFAPLTFSPPALPVSPLWSVIAGPTTFTFDLETVSVDFQDADELNLSGLGTLMATGFDDTPGSWTFSGNSSGVIFTFSSAASPTPVPEPMSLLLVSFGLGGLMAAGTRR